MNSVSTPGRVLRRLRERMAAAATVPKLVVIWAKAMYLHMRLPASPRPYLKNNNAYFPGLEEIGPDEMRISFVGSCPFPPRRDQAGTSIMVEMGNGKCFFFDFGSGCMRNIVAMQVPLPMINDIFITHLHVDHYADVPYTLPFTASFGRFKPLRLTGPSGRTPELGTKAIVENMHKMLAAIVPEGAPMPKEFSYPMPKIPREAQQKKQQGDA